MCFDGPVNFLLWGIYAKSKTTENSYYVNTFALDYASAILGLFGSLSGGLPPSYFATSMYRNNSLESNLESYGIFGEVYFDLSDRLTLTGGLRYNNAKKDVPARTTLISLLNPYATEGSTFATPLTPIPGPPGLFVAAPGTPAHQRSDEGRGGKQG